MFGGACALQLPGAEPPRAAPGESFRLHGEGFGDGCHDTGLPLLKEPPQREIRVDMRQEGRSWDLVSGLEAGGLPDSVLDAEMEVPAGAVPGRAQLVVTHPRDGRSLRVPFRVVDGGPSG